MVKHTCVGLCDTRLTEIKRHTVHAEDIINTCRKKIDKKNHDLHLAGLTMYQASADNHCRGCGHLQPAEAERGIEEGEAE